MSQWHHLYNTRAWRRRRELQLRLHPACRWCREVDGRLTAATVADHVTPHRGDPVLFAGPLQSLCKHCHDSKKQQLERTGHVRGCDARGVPLDPSHPWRQDAERERSGVTPGGDIAFRRDQ